MAADFPAGACMIFGASGGIGQGMAREFARAGSAVALCYRSKLDVAYSLGGIRYFPVDRTTFLGLKARTRAAHG